MLKDDRNPRALAALPDEALIDAVQRQTFRYFWDGADAASGLALDRRTLAGLDDSDDDKVSIGGTGFAVMAFIYGRRARLGDTRRSGAGALEPHARRSRSKPPLAITASIRQPMHGGATGATIPFWRKDDGANLVETALLVQGLLCARQYFSRDTAGERRLRGRHQFALA